MNLINYVKDFSLYLSEQIAVIHPERLTLETYQCAKNTIQPLLKMYYLHVITNC